ncbi:MAG TPA: hypothetical protein ENI94_05525 [Gammaproteobacteria bacterium]|nr:hypothetical protein [Gammaproteobacteria bacterium]
MDIPEWLDWLPVVRKKGGEVAPRILPMPLELSALRARSGLSRRKDKLLPPPESWRELGEHPIELLREIERYLKRINGERLPPRRRLSWMIFCLQYACPAIRKIYSEHHKGDAVPETHDRREGLLVAIHVCAQLSMGFKHILRHDYQLSDARYRRVRVRVRECAQLVLELIRMEQRLRALRYQKLPATAWLDCNRIFFAIRQCEDVHAEHKALSCLQVPLERKDGNTDLSRRLPQQISIHQLFILIQLFGLMDTNTVSSQKMHIVDVQLAKVLPKLKAVTDTGAALATGQVIVYGNQDRPPFFERQDEKAEASLARQQLLAEEVQEQGATGGQQVPVAVCIDLMLLEESLRQEHEQLYRLFDSSDADDRSRMVVDSQDLTRLLTVDAMCDKLHMKRRQHPRKYSLGKKILYVYTGFMSVYQLLMEAAVADDERALLSDEHQLRDALAERSALIATDRDSSSAGQWFVMDISAGGVHIKTRESQFITALFIGQLVAFGYTRDELQSPTVAYVSRFLRNGADIEVTLRTLSTRVEATALQSDFLSQSDMALPAIWVRLTDGREGVILHQSHRLSQATAVSLEQAGERVSRTIQSTGTLQREFVLHVLQ